MSLWRFFMILYEVGYDKLQKRQVFTMIRNF